MPGLRFSACKFCRTSLRLQPYPSHLLRGILFFLAQASRSKGWPAWRVYFVLLPPAPHFLHANGGRPLFQAKRSTGDWEHLAETCDHKPDIPFEKKRIRAAGEWAGNYRNMCVATVPPVPKKENETTRHGTICLCHSLAGSVQQRILVDTRALIAKVHTQRE